MTTANDCAVVVDGVEIPTRDMALVTKGRRFLTMTMLDDATEQAALMVIADCKGVEKTAKTELDEKLDPLRLRINLTREPFDKRIALFKGLREGIEGWLTKQRTARAMARQQEQQRLIEEKAKADREAEAAANKERERLRRLEEDMANRTCVPSAADAKALAAQEARVEKAVAREAEVKAAPVDVVAQQQKTVELADGTKITTKKHQIPVFANGVPVEDGAFDRSDQRFLALPDICFVFKASKLNLLVKVTSTDELRKMGVLMVDAPTLAVKNSDKAVAARAEKFK